MQNDETPGAPMAARLTEMGVYRTALRMIRAHVQYTGHVCDWCGAAFADRRHEPEFPYRIADEAIKMGEMRRA